MMKKVLSTAMGMFLSAAVSAQPVDLAKSSVTATFKQTGVAVDTKFTRFKADVSFDPAAPEKTSANMQVDITSFDLGDPEYNKEVQKPEWFNSAKYAQATFVTQSVRAISADRLEASGTLTIKGKAQPVVVPITVKQTGNTRTFSGELPIKRLVFKIGEGDWSDTDIVADEVKIKFTVVTAAQ
ncbi:MAG: YceI family protein [Spongiibacteraceae bacterium]